MYKRQKFTEVEFNFEKQVRIRLREMPFHNDIISKYQSFSLSEDDFYMVNKIRVDQYYIHCRLPKFGQELKSRAAKDHELFKMFFDGVSQNQLSTSILTQAKDSIEKLFDTFEKFDF